MNKFMYSGLFLGILSMHLNLSAAPVISVDSIDFDAGIVYEGTNKVIKHAFILKNTGDKPLVIERVKASCGCTAVSYDSIIQPGATGKVVQEIATDRISFGEFRKYVNVFSNAKNNETLRLSLGGILKSYVDFSPNYIQMAVDSTEKKLKTEIQLSSTTKDLKISEISFKSYNDAATGPSWQSSLPLYVDFKLTGPSEDPKTKNSYSYKLKITTDLVNKTMQQGRFAIKTNHPLKPEVTVEGSML
ncbi:MAG TPA: DUF1573 domain-containing protein [Chitinispirillaceae bacterium]|nr:DUF1573 domain-containing protein [Chitinispirillaceae bacterium]